MAVAVHNCPTNEGEEIPLVTLIGVIEPLRLVSWWGSWCGSCGAVWQSELQVVAPVSAQECYDRGLEAFGHGGRLN